MKFFPSLSKKHETWKNVTENWDCMWKVPQDLDHLGLTWPCGSRRWIQEHLRTPAVTNLQPHLWNVLSHQMLRSALTLQHRQLGARIDLPHAVGGCALIEGFISVGPQRLNPQHWASAVVKVNHLSGWEVMQGQVIDILRWIMMEETECGQKSHKHQKCSDFLLDMNELTSSRKPQRFLSVVPGLRNTESNTGITL